MSDLIERLKDWHRNIDGQEAADALEQLEADAKRMDYLESEAIREIDLAEPRPSLFRRNMPITRQSVDEAMKVALAGEQNEESDLTMHDIRRMYDE